MFGAAQFLAWLLHNSEESGPALFDTTQARLPLSYVLQIKKKNLDKSVTVLVLLCAA